MRWYAESAKSGMEDAIKLTTRMRRLFPLSWCLGVVTYCHTIGRHYRFARFGPFRLSSLWLHEREFIPVARKWKLQWWIGSKNSQQNFTKQGIHPLIGRRNIAIERKGDYVEKLRCDPLTTKFILMYDTCACVGNYSCTKQKSSCFWHNFIPCFPNSTSNDC